MHLIQHEGGRSTGLLIQHEGGLSTRRATFPYIFPYKISIKDLHTQISIHISINKLWVDAVPEAQEGGYPLRAQKNAILLLN